MHKDQPELFDTQDQPLLPSGDQAERRLLYYVTNANNLHGILASGLIRCQSGWKSYEEDLQQWTPGMIPLFVGGYPEEGPKIATEYDPHDFPVIIEVDLEDCQCEEMVTWTSSGEQSLGTYPDNLPDSVCLLAMRGVIPVVNIRAVYFESDKDKTRFITDCVPLSTEEPKIVEHYIRSFDSLALVQDFQAPKVDAEETSGNEDNDYQELRRLDAIGGILGALIRFERNLAPGLLQRLFPGYTPEWGTESQSCLADHLSDNLEQWISNPDGSVADPEAIVMRGCLEQLAQQEFSSGLSPELFLQDLEKTVCQTLSDKMPSDNHAEKFSKRIASLKDVVIRNENPATFFDHVGSCVTRGLLLFLLDDEYRQPRQTPRGCNVAPLDRLIAELYRGALHGWSRLPVIMRGSLPMQRVVGYAMARFSHADRNDIRYSERAISWIDKKVELTRFLRAIAKCISEDSDPTKIQGFADSQNIDEIEINLKIKGEGSLQLAKTEKSVKKIKRLHFNVLLPWRKTKK